MAFFTFTELYVFFCRKGIPGSVGRWSSPKAGLDMQLTFWDKEQAVKLARDRRAAGPQQSRLSAESIGDIEQQVLMCSPKRCRLLPFTCTLQLSTKKDEKKVYLV
jgi:hypothetical protein